MHLDSYGLVNYPITSFFANVPQPEIEAALRQYGLRTDQVATPYTCLFVDTGQHRVMIDLVPAILAPTPTRSFRASTIPLPRAAASSQTCALGWFFACGRGHRHHHPCAYPDHVGGALDDTGNLIFAGARYFIGRAEWDYWMSEAAAASTIPMAALVRRNLAPLRERIGLFEDGNEIVPGIRAIATPGHTAGHMALSITSDGEELLHVSDAVLFPLHLEHPDRLPVFDLSPAQAAASKQSIFDYAAEQHALVFAHHFPTLPQPGLCDHPSSRLAVATNHKRWRLTVPACGTVSRFAATTVNSISLRMPPLILPDQISSSARTPALRGRFAARVPLLIISSIAVEVICQETPYLSLSQPHCSASGTAESSPSSSRFALAYRKVP